MTKKAQWSLHRIGGPAAPSRPVVLRQVDAEVVIDEIGAPGFLPALLTPEGVLQPLLAYFAGKWQTRPRAWMNKVVRAVGLFVRYASVQPDGIEDAMLLREFVARLHAGTVGEDGRDPTGLGWHPLSETVADQTVRALARFFDFLVATGTLNPSASEDRYGRLVIRCATCWHLDKGCLPLGHRADRLPRSLRAAASSAAPTPLAPFPEDRLADLLFDGFKSTAGVDYRGMLITLLLNGAGLEVFEPFHLYTTDVVAEPGGEDRVSLCIRHPAGPSRPVSNPWMHDAMRRADYLRKRWKASDPAEDNAAFMVCWSCPDMEALFGSLWIHYRGQLPLQPRDHPYAFVSLRGAARGRPYTVGQFSHAHAAACERIGLQVSRAAGTTLDSHRLAYEQRLNAASLVEAPPLLARCA